MKKIALMLALSLTTMIMACNNAPPTDDGTGDETTFSIPPTPQELPVPEVPAVEDETTTTTVSTN